MRRNAPKRFFTGVPDAVDDLIDEASALFDTFGDHEFLQLLAPAVSEPFVMCSVTRALKLEGKGRRKLFPRRL